METGRGGVAAADAVTRPVRGELFLLAAGGVRGVHTPVRTPFSGSSRLPPRYPISPFGKFLNNVNG